MPRLKDKPRIGSIVPPASCKMLLWHYCFRVLFFTVLGILSQVSQLTNDGPCAMRGGLTTVRLQLCSEPVTRGRSPVQPIINPAVKNSFLICKQHCRKALKHPQHWTKRHHLFTTLHQLSSSWGSSCTFTRSSSPQRSTQSGGDSSLQALADRQCSGWCSQTPSCAAALGSQTPHAHGSSWIDRIHPSGVHIKQWLMWQGEFGFDGSVLQVIIKVPYNALKKTTHIQDRKYYAVTRGGRFYPEFILCASSEILHSTGLLLSSVLWVKHAILERERNSSKCSPY